MPLLLLPGEPLAPSTPAATAPAQPYNLRGTTGPSSSIYPPRGSSFTPLPPFQVTPRGNLVPIAPAAKPNFNAPGTSGPSTSIYAKPGALPLPFGPPPALSNFPLFFKLATAPPPIRVPRAQTVQPAPPPQITIDPLTPVSGQQINSSATSFSVTFSTSGPNETILLGVSCGLDGSYPYPITISSPGLNFVVAESNLASGAFANSAGATVYVAQAAAQLNNQVVTIQMSNTGTASGMATVVALMNASVLVGAAGGLWTPGSSAPMSVTLTPQSAGSFFFWVVSDNNTGSETFTAQPGNVIITQVKDTTGAHSYATGYAFSPTQAITTVGTAQSDDFTATAAVEIRLAQNAVVAALTPVPVSQIQGNQNPTAQLAATTPVPTSAIAASVGVGATVSATAPRPTSQIQATQAVGANISATAPRPTSVIQAALGNAASIAATTPVPTSVIHGDQTVAHLASTTPLVTSAIDGTVSSPGVQASIAAVSPRPTSNIHAAMGNHAQLASTTLVPTSAIQAKLGNHATIAATSPAPISAIQGKVATRAQIAAISPEPTSSIHGSSTSARLVATSPEPVSRIAAEVGATASLASTTPAVQSAIGVDVIGFVRLNFVVQNSASVIFTAPSAFVTMVVDNSASIICVVRDT